MSEDWVQHDGGYGPMRYGEDHELTYDPNVTVRIRAIRSREQVLAKGYVYRASQLRWKWLRNPSPGDIMEYVIRPN